MVEGANSAARRPRIVVVCGSKYSFRSVYLPMVRALARSASVTLLLLDFPKEYEIHPLLRTLHHEGVLTEWTIVPPERPLWRHHAQAVAFARAIEADRLDAVVVDLDLLPMHQYVIRAARRHSCPVIGVPKVVSTRLIVAHEEVVAAGVPLDLAVAYDRAVSRSGPGYSNPGGPLWRRRLAIAESEWIRTLNYMVMPLLFTGRPCTLESYERRGVNQFVSTRVDAAVTFTRLEHEALAHFFPLLKLIRARHPLAANCRCTGSAVSRRVLIALGGPWRIYAGRGFDLDSIQDRWVDNIAMAAALGGFAEIDIRPHPREASDVSERIATGLRGRGLRARVLEATQQSLADVICDYAGIIGAPSGILTEAAEACGRAFVIGLQSIEPKARIRLVHHYTDHIVARRDASELRPEDFSLRRPAIAGLPAVADVVLAFARGESLKGVQEELRDAVTV